MVERSLPPELNKGFVFSLKFFGGLHQAVSPHQNRGLDANESTFRTASTTKKPGRIAKAYEWFVSKRGPSGTGRISHHRCNKTPGRDAPRFTRCDSGFFRQGLGRDQDFI